MTIQRNWQHRIFGTQDEEKKNMTQYVLDTTGDTKQSRLESTTEIVQNKHVKVLHYFVDDIK